jgi:hypothetical protein
MDEKELEQIEADVVVVIKGEGRGEVHPFWECNLLTIKLEEFAIEKALQLVEEIGQGEATYQIYDFRPADWEEELSDEERKELKEKKERKELKEKGEEERLKYTNWFPGSD